MNINTGFGPEQHRFAFCISSVGTHDSLTVHDRAFVRRLKTVLRLREQDNCTLFDDKYSVDATILSLHDDAIIFSLSNKKEHSVLTPSISWLLPLLKKDAFEQALYTLTELGVSKIQPIVTQKACRTWGSEKDFLRARTIQIAAAEQSKQFSIPHIHSVKKLEEVDLSDSERAIFFDVQGKPLSQILDTLKGAQILTVCSGPEGDLTHEEKNYLAAHGFVFCTLTPTILRAQQAIAVGLGGLRTFCINYS